MPEEKQETKPTEPTHDAFGAPLKPEAPPVVEPEKKEEKKEAPVVDIATHPVVVELTKKVNDQAEMLSGQGKVIRKLKKGGGEGADDKDLKVDLPHKEIKRSKDLTEEERDEMTQNEIKMMDELADAKERENKAAIEKAKASRKPQDDEEGADEELDEEGNAFDPKIILAAEIRALAGGDTERERELKEAAALTNFAGLKSKADIAARLKLGAEKFIPNWKAPKEQPSGTGAPVKAGGDSATDPYGVDKIVREARQGSTGNYTL